MEDNKVNTKQLIIGLETIQKFNRNIKTGKYNGRDWKNEVYLQIKDGALSANTIACEGYHQIHFKMPIINGYENIETGIVGLDTLVKAIKKFDENTYIHIDNNKAVISDGKKNVTLKTVEYYSFKDIDFADGNTNIVAGQHIKMAIDKVKKAISDNTSKQILQGIHFNKNYLETCDGYRVFQVTLQGTEFDDFTVLPEYIDILSSIGKKYKTIIEIKRLGKNYQVNTNIGDLHFTLNGRVLDGQFPDTEKFFYDSNISSILIDFDDKSELLNEVEFMYDVYNSDDNDYDVYNSDDNDKKSPLILDISRNLFQMTRKGKESGATTTIQKFEVIKYEYDENFTMGLNAKYLLEILKSIDDKHSMHIAIGRKTSPMILFSENEKYLIMPIRL